MDLKQKELADKKRKKTLVQAEKELKLAMQKVIEKYKALNSAELCNCKQNKVYDEYFASDKKSTENSYNGKIAVLITNDAENFIDRFDEVDRSCEECPAIFLPNPVKNLDDNTELKAWYKKE